MTKLNLLRSAAVLTLAAGAFAATPAIAQTAEPAAEREGEIVVAGIRASLAAAAAVKRDASQVIDVVTAQDVATLPDANVAEALQRITGVQITRVFGEGQAVSVRGLQQVRVEVDGRTLLGWSARLSPPENDQLGRSSGLDSVPSSLFGRLEVRKSPLASQAEGGLGGTVNLVTPRPFDFRETTIALRASGTYSEVSNVFEPAVTGLFTTRLFDDRVGILVAAEYQQRTSTVQSFERNNFVNRNYTVPAAGGGTMTVVRPTPVLLQYERFVVDRSRLGITGALQFRATPELTITIDGIYSQLETGRVQDFLSWRLPTANNPVTNAVVDSGFVVAGQANGTLQTAGQLRNEPTESHLYGANLKWKNGPWTIELDGYYSRGTIDQTIQIITLQANAAVPGTFDFRGGAIPSLQLGTAAVPFDATNYANYSPLANGVRSNRLLGVLEEWTGRFDVSWKSDDVTLHLGARYTDLGARSNAFRSQTSRPRAEIEPLTGVITNVLPDITGNFPQTYRTTLPTRDYVFTTAVGAQPNPANLPALTLLPNIQRDYVFNERVFAAYFMFSAEGEVLGMPVRANAGARLARTSVVVDTFLSQGAAFIPRTDRNSFTNVLPSANIVFNVTDRLLVRLSASQTMQRASIADLAPSLFFNQTNLSVTGGNAMLRPPISTQGDLSVEFYTSRTSLFSAALFYKSIKDFITTINSQQIVPGLEAFGLLQTSFPDNVASARIYGFEVGVQQFFDFLPAPFDGFGIIANYTYSNSRDNQGFPLGAVSKHSYNLIGLFERGPIKARVAYNYRSAALFEFTAGAAGALQPSYIGGRSQLDAQLGFDITDEIQLNLQAQNLSPADSATIEYSVIPTALNSYALSERRFTIGLRAKF